MSKRLNGRWPIVRLVLVAVCAWILVGAPCVQAQDVTAAHGAPVAVKAPSYDVVSVKPNKTGSGHFDIWIDDGNFTAVNVSLKTLILSAYGLKESQMAGLPKWGTSARFDIKAKIINPNTKTLEALTDAQFRSMQQPILTDRFQLKFHREMKMLPVFELVVVKGGPKFKAITAAESASDAGVSGVRAGGMRIRDRTLIGTGLPLSSLADQLSGQVQRIVVDKTGLAGKYNFQLSWSPDDSGPAAPDSGAPPGIFTALQEQLGLKLKPGKAEIETFVVDHVEMPSED